MREGFVVFGMLHLIGILVILACPCLKLRSWNLLMDIVFISLGIYLKNFTFVFSWLMWLGLMPDHFYAVDHFPIFPWFGVILIGVFVGNLGYHEYTWKFNFCEFSNSNFSFIRLFCFLGRHSLLIYLIHQPILITLLYFQGIVNIIIP